MSIFKVFPKGFLVLVTILILFGIFLIVGLITTLVAPRTYQLLGEGPLTEVSLWNENFTIDLGDIRYTTGLPSGPTSLTPGTYYYLYEYRGRGFVDFLGPEWVVVQEPK